MPVALRPRCRSTVHEFEERAFDPAYLLTPHDVAASVIHCLSLPRTAEVTDIAIRPMRKAPNTMRVPMTRSETRRRSGLTLCSGFD